MSKKHFVAVAAEINGAIGLAKNNSNTIQSEAAINAIKVVAFGLSHVFAAQNSKFNRNTFLAACGIV